MVEGRVTVPYDGFLLDRNKIIFSIKLTVLHSCKHLHEYIVTQNVDEVNRKTLLDLLH